MLPIFAAISAAHAVGKIADEAVSLWQRRSSASAGGKAETPGSFASLLQAAGADVGKHLHGVAATITSAASAISSASQAGSINRLL
jgi:hypothetical protein